MITQQQSGRRDQAAAELHEHCPELNSQQVVDSLTAGLTHLRNLLLVRVHDDVQREYGTDSMTTTSLSRMEIQARYAKVEIEAYACVVVADEVNESRYVDNSADWFLEWLFRLRLGAKYKPVFDKRVDYYHSQTIEDRRLKFVSVLQRAIPESGRAPLVLFRLFPRSLRILAAVAFGDPLRAQQLRAEQAALLPAISDCSECHGCVLDNEDICRYCGNPVWNFNWLLSD